MKKKFSLRRLPAILMSVALIFSMSLGDMGVYAEGGAGAGEQEVPVVQPEKNQEIDLTEVDKVTKYEGGALRRGYMVYTPAATPEEVSKLELNDIWIDVDYTSSQKAVLKLPEKSCEIILKGLNSITRHASDSIEKGTIIQQGSSIDFASPEIKDYSLTISGDGSLRLYSTIEYVSAIDVDGTLKVAGEVLASEVEQHARYTAVSAGNLEVSGTLEATELKAKDINVTGNLLGKRPKFNSYEMEQPAVECYGNFTQAGGNVQLHFARGYGYILMHGDGAIVAENLVYTRKAITNGDEQNEAVVIGDASTDWNYMYGEILFSLGKTAEDSPNILKIPEGSKLLILEGEELEFTQSDDSGADIAAEIRAYLLNSGTIVNNGNIVLKLKAQPSAEEAKALIAAIGKLEGTGVIYIKVSAPGSGEYYTNSGEPLVAYSNSIDLSAEGATVPTEIASAVKWTPATAEDPAKLELGNIYASAETIVIPDGQEVIVELKGTSLVGSIEPKKTGSEAQPVKITIMSANESEDTMLSMEGIVQDDDSAPVSQLKLQKAKVVAGKINNIGKLIMEQGSELLTLQAMKIGSGGGDVAALNLKDGSKLTAHINNDVTAVTVLGNTVIESGAELDVDSVERGLVTSKLEIKGGKLKAKGKMEAVETGDVEMEDATVDASSRDRAAIDVDNGDFKAGGNSKIDLHCSYGISFNPYGSTTKETMEIGDNVALSINAYRAPVLIGFKRPAGISDEDAKAIGKSLIKFNSLKSDYKSVGLLGTGSYSNVIYGTIVAKDADTAAMDGNDVINSGLAGKKVILSDGTPATPTGPSGPSSSGGGSGHSATPPPAVVPKAPEKEEIFSDIQSHWAKKSIEFVAAKGYMKGVGDKKFAPEIGTTRAMVATILYNIEGRPQVNTAAKLGDIGGRWYEAQVAWAADKGIVDGYGDGLFRGDRDITREQMAKLLYKYTLMKKWDATADVDLSVYTDTGSISEYAKEPMRWAVKHGIISGMTANTLDPQGTLTRAQIATMLERYVKQYVK